MWYIISVKAIKAQTYYIMTIKPNRTPAYQFTVDMSSEEDMESVRTFRKKFYGTGKYVKLQGRWGKNNPHYTPNKSWHGGHQYFVPLGVASSADVYVYERY